jgi:hypothetical protein
VSTGRDLLKELEDDFQVDLAYWQRTHEGITEDLLFWGGQHYLDEEDLRERDRRRLKIVGQETFNVTRHKSAQVGGAPTNVDGVIKEKGVDPIMGEVGTALVNSEVSDPEKLFDDYCDILLTGCISAGMWLMGIDYEPTLEEIVFRPLDPRNCVWEAGFHNPHDVMCGRFTEERRLPVSLIKEMGSKNVEADIRWKHTDEILPDADNRPSAKGADQQFPSGTGDDGKATIRFTWRKHDTTRDITEKSFAPLPPEEWRMTCAECGWRGEIGLGQDLPETDVCPDCGAATQRTEGEAEMEVRQRYKRGRRLIIWAPNSGLDEPLYDGPWPCYLRSFPIGFLSNYLHPAKPIGPSDTSLNWTAQLGSDLLMTMAFQRVSEFRNYYLMPAVGVEDWKGDRFEFRDDQFNVLYYKDEMNPSNVQVLNGSSLDPAWNMYWQATQTVLKSVQGISDLGLGPSQSKDIAASTVSQLNQMGEIPVEHLKRRWHREKARIFGIVYDFCRAFYTNEDLASLQIEGLDDVVVNLSGSDLPDMDFVLTDAGPMGAIEKTRAEGTMLLVTAAQQAPEWIDFIAQANRIPPSVLRKVKKKMAEMQAQQQQMMLQQQRMAGGPSGTPNQAGPTGNPNGPASGTIGPPPQMGMQGVGGMEPPR